MRFFSGTEKKCHGRRKTERIFTLSHFILIQFIFPKCTSTFCIICMEVFFWLQSNSFWVDDVCTYLICANMLTMWMIWLRIVCVYYLIYFCFIIDYHCISVFLCPFLLSCVVFQSLSSSESVTPDDDTFKHLATIYSTNHKRMYQGRPCKGQSGFKNGITNGAKWYPLIGKWKFVFFHGWKWKSSCFSIQIASILTFSLAKHTLLECLACARQKIKCLLYCSLFNNKKNCSIDSQEECKTSTTFGTAAWKSRWKSRAANFL